MESTNEYIPGTCNIGPAEMKRRKGAAIFSLFLTIVVAVLILVLAEEKLWRLIIFIPVSAFAVNFQQVYYSFCVNFGLRGIFNFGNLHQHDTVEQAEYRKKDRQKAIRMITTGIIAGLVAAGIFYLI